MLKNVKCSNKYIKQHKTRDKPLDLYFYLFKSSLKCV